MLNRKPKPQSRTSPLWLLSGRHRFRYQARCTHARSTKHDSLTAMVRSSQGLAGSVRKGPGAAMSKDDDYDYLFKALQPGDVGCAAACRVQGLGLKAPTRQGRGPRVAQLPSSCSLFCSPTKGWWRFLCLQTALFGSSGVQSRSHPGKLPSCSAHHVAASHLAAWLESDFVGTASM